VLAESEMGSLEIRSLATSATVQERLSRAEGVSHVTMAAANSGAAGCSTAKYRAIAAAVSGYSP
jgi:hypothetical protein